jgi:hypothetical protein
MRDKLSTFSDLTVTGTAATIASTDAWDFQAGQTGTLVNTAKFGGHHTGRGGRGDCWMVFQVTQAIAIGNMLALIVQDSADDSTYIDLLTLGNITVAVPAAGNPHFGGQVTSVATVGIPAGTTFVVPIPTSHRRYLRPAVKTGATFGGSSVVKAWVEEGVVVK